MSKKHPIFDHIQRDVSRSGETGQTDQARDQPAFDAEPNPAFEKASSDDAELGFFKRLLSRSDRLPPSTIVSSQLETHASSPTPHAAPPSRAANKTHRALANQAKRRWLAHQIDDLLIAQPGDIDPKAKRYADLLIASPGQPNLPDDAFTRLRWGGLMLFTGTSERSTRNLAEAYDNKRGFVLEQPITPIRTARFGLPLPGLTTKGFAFLARKTRLLQPGDFTERFTYDVRLTACPVTPATPDGYLVTKRVPTHDDLLGRLKQKFPDADPRDLEKRSHKLIEHVFPTFLTREAAMLGILQKQLDPAFRDRVPKPLGIEKDERGFVRTLHMNWMRVGGSPISQLDFAIQSAELLQAIHEQARIMHLDLRMDNMVITPNGVGFVDFGSACRIGEKVEQSPMLDALFTEMMRTSQIQRMLGKMIERGHVTNNAIAEVYGKVDKTVDAFYLAVQIAKPHANPELAQLIDYDPDTDAAHALSALTAAVLRPKNPEMAQYKTAGDLVRGLRRIERRVGRSGEAA